jgi:menaquinone-dependent protoporphyrinogen IX oxidase
MEVKMNKTLVIYSSKYGYTEKYAQWLAEEPDIDICESKNLNVDKLNDYFTIIFGSSLYAGKNKGATMLVNYFEQIKDKRIGLFTVGVFDTNSDENIANINKELNKVITPAIREQIRIFHLRGGIDCRNLSFSHKMIMKFVHSSLLKKPENELTDGDRDILALYGKDIDFSDKKTLTPIIRYCTQTGK